MVGRRFLPSSAAHSGGRCIVTLCCADRYARRPIFNKPRGRTDGRRVRGLAHIPPYPLKQRSILSRVAYHLTDDALRAVATPAAPHRQTTIRPVSRHDVTTQTPWRVACVSTRDSSGKEYLAYRHSATRSSNRTDWGAPGRIAACLAGDTLVVAVDVSGSSILSPIARHLRSTNSSNGIVTEYFMTLTDEQT